MRLYALLPSHMYLLTIRLSWGEVRIVSTGSYPHAGTLTIQSGFLRFLVEISKGTWLSYLALCVIQTEALKKIKEEKPAHLCGTWMFRYQREDYGMPWEHRQKVRSFICSLKFLLLSRWHNRNLNSTILWMSLGSKFHWTEWNLLLGKHA